MQDSPALVRRSSSPKHPALRNIDPATRFLYTPKTVSALLIGTVISLCRAEFLCRPNASCRVHATLDSHNFAGLGTIVYLSRAFNPPPHPTDELEAARNGNRNAKFGLGAAALSYLCKIFVLRPLQAVLIHLYVRMIERLSLHGITHPCLLLKMSWLVQAIPLYKGPPLL